MDKNKVLSFFVLLISFVLILAVIELFHYGSIVGYSVKTDFLDFKLDESVLSNIVFYFFIFLLLVGVLLFSYRFYLRNKVINEYRRNSDSRFVKIKFDR